MSDSPKPTTTELRPMGLGPAIEVMKLLAPYAPAMLFQKTVGDAIRKLLQAAQTDDPVDILRILALMNRKHLDEIAVEFENKAGADLVAALAVGFEANSLPDLINASALLGLTKVRWPDA